MDIKSVYLAEFSKGGELFAISIDSNTPSKKELVIYDGLNVQIIDKLENKFSMITCL
jgi:hypothetical protein